MTLITASARCARSNVRFCYMLSNQRTEPIDKTEGEKSKRNMIVVGRSRAKLSALGWLHRRGPGLRTWRSYLGRSAKLPFKDAGNASFVDQTKQGRHGAASQL